MENTPAKIAADVLSAAMAAKSIYIESTAPEGIASAFAVIHAAIHEAAKKDYDANLFKAHS